MKNLKLEDGEAEPEIVRPVPTNLGIRFLKDLSAYKASLVIVLVPLLGSPLLFLNSSEATCAYCVLIMALYWMFEVMPLAATALMPTFLFPMLGVVSSKEICMRYLPDTNFLFIGGLIIAVAVEKCNLHERIALRVLTIVGSKPQCMWISNTATTAMMVPIAESVIFQLLKANADSRTPAEEKKQNPDDEIAMGLVRHEIDDSHKEAKSPEQTDKEKAKDLRDINFALLSRQEQLMAKGLLICIAFAANVGGTGTITGTPPNLVMVGILGTLYPGVESPISYAIWMAFAIPCMLVSLAMCWICLVVYFLGFRVFKTSRSDSNVNQMMRNKYRSLPRWSFAEISVLFMFIILLCLWILRAKTFGKWFKEDEKKKSYYSDATSAMLIATILFMLPNELPTFLCFRNRDRTKDPTIRGALMDWPSMQAKFPWSVVMLLGGGFALAHGVKVSGLSNMVGDLLSKLEGTETIVIQLICVLITMIITNICSNTVTATIFVPIVDSLAKKVHTNPLAFMLPTTLACSYAFTLPVATPPNAIVFASGLLRVSDLMKSGLFVTLFSAIIIVANMQTWALLVFNLNEYPAWAMAGNSTVTG